jgi:ketosteroid isomerase-like protein
MIVDGELAAVQQRLTATTKAKGEAYDNQYCWVYSCPAGEISHIEEYADTLYAARTMGWKLEGEAQ